MKILWFFGLVITGFLFLYFAYPLYKITGSFDWVEKYTGPGGTITFFRLVGAALIIFGFIYLIKY
jgi:amino acid permease